MGRHFLSMSCRKIQIFFSSAEIVYKMSDAQTWLDGNYKVLFNGKIVSFAEADGNNVAFLDDEGNVKNKVILKTGKYKEADNNICEQTGKQHFTILMQDPLKAGSDSFGVISDDGRLMTVKGSHGMTFTMEWIDDAKAKELKDVLLNEKDPADAPPNHYTLRPGQAGKIFWISGLPGSGKSTTARRMMETEGFVYYEGDCFMSNKNPYIPVAENSAIDATIAARPLRGVSKARKEGLSNALKEWTKMKKGEEFDLEEFYSLLCENIIQERRRVGGDWVVAQAVPTRKLREFVKSLLGPELVFVVLDLDAGLQKERLKPRLGAFDVKYFDMKFEVVQKDEVNTIDFKITDAMTLENVVASILAIPSNS